MSTRTRSTRTQGHGFTADEVALRLAREDRPRRPTSTSSGGGIGDDGYQPNQSLFDGDYQQLSYDSDFEQDNDPDSLFKQTSTPISVGMKRTMPFTSPGSLHHQHVHVDEHDSAYTQTPLRGSSMYNRTMNSLDRNYHVTPGRHAGRVISDQCGVSSNQRADWVALFQEQQKLLTEILENQQNMRKKQREFRQELSDLSKRLDNSSSSLDSSGGEKLGRKSRVCRDLSRKVTAVHDALENGGFHQSEGSTSEYNKQVKAQILSEICSLPDCKYDKDQVKAAIQRKYESVRRMWKLEENTESDDIRQNVAKVKKYWARCRRKYENRTMVVQSAEQELWKDICIEDMSCESDDPENPNNLVVHRPKWCSKEFTRFKDTLDKRYQDKVKKDGLLVARKNRIIGSPMTVPPHPEAAEWMVNREWESSTSDD